MIIDSVFQEFIKVVQENRNYTIGLLNGDGKVTACSDENLIGSVQNVDAPDSNNLFYRIRVKNVDYGWLWLYGKDENLEMMGNLINDSLSIRLTYEITQNMMKSTSTDDDQLMKLLLDNDLFDTDQILQLADQIGFDRTRSRVAICLYSEKGFESRKVSRIKMLPEGDTLLCSLLHNYSLLIVYAVPDEVGQEEIREQVKKFLKTLQGMELSGDTCWIGSIQRKLKNYKESYNHCLWLRDNVKRKKGEAVFFFDYLYPYFQSKIGIQDIKGIFGYYYGSNSKGLDIKELVRIADALYENNFNISQAAESLFLHKNTLIYKLKKYEETFQIDIRGDFKGGFLFILIASMMKEYQKRQQVGEDI